MMSDEKKTKLGELLDQSIALEYNALRLYMLFAELYPEDRVFWKRISQEEMFHAELLEGLRPPLKANALPDDMLSDNLAELKESNTDISEAIEIFAKDKPNREDAFNYALALETTGSELIFQKIVTRSSDKKIEKAFKSLAGFCKDHAKRIRTWMRTNKLLVKHTPFPSSKIESQSDSKNISDPSPQKIKTERKPQ